MYKYIDTSLSRCCSRLPELDVAPGITKAAESAETEGIELSFGAKETLKLCL